MEYDGYCPDRKLAFEYHGNQHFVKGRKTLENVQELNKAKRKVSAREKVKNLELVAIPFCTTVQEFVIYALGVVAEAGLDILCSDIDQILSNVVLQDCPDFERTRQIIAEKGGECLSHIYINKVTKIRVRCANGHVWETIPNSLMLGHWCKPCAMKEHQKRQKEKRAAAQTLAQAADKQ